MTADTLDTLLAQWSAGDTRAAEQLFVAYAPYLRRLVRRRLTPRLRAKFDSVDVVQSVMADVLRRSRKADWRFPDADHLRAFLAKAARHRLIDCCRQHASALEREQPCEGTDLEDHAPSLHPRPSQTVQANDLWRQMLALCPPRYHGMLELKRQGLSLQEIAGHTGLHADSIRRILRTLARRLALQQADPLTAAPEE